MLLREWRAARRVSQLHLALEAGTSSRHLSYLETGKAQPSRGMIGRLAEALDMPLRERNALLLAAGFAPEYTETGLDAPELASVRRAIEFILEHQNPYPAFVLNRRWDILMANQGARHVGNFLLGRIPHLNMVRQFLDPDDMRRVVVNWEEVAGDLIRHLHDEVAAAPSDTKARAAAGRSAALSGSAGTVARARVARRPAAGVDGRVPEGRHRAPILLDDHEVRHAARRDDRRPAHRMLVPGGRGDGRSCVARWLARPAARRLDSSTVRQCTTGLDAPLQGSVGSSARGGVTRRRGGRGERLSGSSRLHRRAPLSHPSQQREELWGRHSSRIAPGPFSVLRAPAPPRDMQCSCSRTAMKRQRCASRIRIRIPHASALNAA
jgi:transcriptional regulator with XRE-family HTH domain